MAKPDSSDTDYYRPGDFAIRAKVEVFKHMFVIQNADLYVLKCMENRRSPQRYHKVTQGHSPLTFN